MDNVADIGLVNPHTKSIGRHHNRADIVKKILLILRPFLIRQSGMVTGGPVAFPDQTVTDLLDILAGGTVNDTTLRPVF